MTSRRVAVVQGGPSPEAEVSRASAAAVAEALEETSHRVTRLELGSRLASELVAHDVVFPVVHGPMGEDGCLQGLLEVLGLSYVGCGVRCSAIAAHKPTAKLHLAAADLPTIEGVRVERGADAEAVRARWTGPLAVKPASGGSAIGVTLLPTDASVGDLQAAIDTALESDDSALVERWARGVEATCGVLDDGQLRPLPPTLIVPQASGFYDFESKYAEGGSRHVCPAPFDAALTRRLQAAAVTAHRALGARDLCRVDFIVDQDAGEFFVLEVNTLPGMTRTSLYPEAAAAAGISFTALCDGFVQRACARPQRTEPPAVPMPD